jgi:phenylalanine ammonia-lyase
VIVDGRSLSVAEVTAVARYGASVELSTDGDVREAIASSRRVIEGKVRDAKSVYGVSTGFGGSGEIPMSVSTVHAAKQCTADTRTSDTLALGHALLQHQHAGVLPVPWKDSTAATPLPLLDPLTSTSMPESWVRAAMLIRLNSLSRGHSGVRWELLEHMAALLRKGVTPLVPLRGSISASGDLSPLSYIAGTLVGNPAIRAWSGPASNRTLVGAPDALAAAGLAPLPLQSKEHLGILNGTAFSAGVAGLALNDAAHLAILTQICTAMGVEALVGTQHSFDPFIHAIARPHPGQVSPQSNDEVPYIDAFISGRECEHHIRSVER